MDTLESIEDELDSSKQIGIKAKLWAKAKLRFMNSIISKLKKQGELLKEIPDINGEEIIKALITGNRKLNDREMEATKRKFGQRGIVMLEGLGNINKAQKQYIFKRMGWDINEVE